MTPAIASVRLTSSCQPSQFSNNNAANIISGGVHYNVSEVTDALNVVNTLNGTLAGFGNALSINGTQTINESAGLLKTIGGTTYRMFNVTSYSSGDGKMLPINGDGSGNPVILNFGFNSNVNLGGDVTLDGLTDDQVLWNFTTSGKNASNNNASSYPDLIFQGIILAPNDPLALTNANIKGRVFGGDSHDFQYVSGTLIDTPGTAVPLPPAVWSGFLVLGALRQFYDQKLPSAKPVQ